MKRVLFALIMMLALVLCACASEPVGDAPQTTVESEAVKESYSIPERKKILADTYLPMPADYYDPVLYDEYFAALEVIRADYKDYGCVPDVAYTTFLLAKEALYFEPNHGYRTLSIEASGINRDNYVNGRIVIIEGTSVVEKLSPSRKRR